jgi:hypothetical protein
MPADDGFATEETGCSSNEGRPDCENVVTNAALDIAGLSTELQQSHKWGRIALSSAPVRIIVYRNLAQQAALTGATPMA